MTMNIDASTRERMSKPPRTPKTPNKTKKIVAPAQKQDAQIPCLEARIADVASTIEGQK